jgi:hypothetical protein
MRHLVCGRLLAAALLSCPPAIGAQDLTDSVRESAGVAALAPCGSLGLWALRGTYAFTATAWQDLSELNPALPKGYAPVSILGAFKLSGNGAVTGWASVNTGGLRLNAEFINSTFGAPQADCGIPISLSMRFKEFEGITGPYPYMGVIAGDGEIDFMMLGAGPGSHVEMNHAKRISMRVY